MCCTISPNNFLSELSKENASTSVVPKSENEFHLQNKEILEMRGVSVAMDMDRFTNLNLVRSSDLYREVLLVNEDKPFSWQETSKRTHCISKVEGDKDDGQHVEDGFHDLKNPDKDTMLNLNLNEQEETPGNDIKMLQRCTPKLFVSRSIPANEGWEISPCKKPKLDEYPVEDNTDSTFKGDFPKDNKTKRKTDTNFSNCCEEISVCSEDSITPPQVNLHLTLNTKKLVSISKADTSLSKIFAVKEKQTLLSGDGIKLQQLITQDKDEIKINWEDGVGKHHKTSSITNYVGQYLHIVTERQEKLSSGESHALQDPVKEVSSCNLDKIISTEQPDQDEVECDVAADRRNQENNVDVVEQEMLQQIVVQEDSSFPGEDLHVHVQLIRDQMVPSFQGEEGCHFHGDDELYTADEATKEVKRWRVDIAEEPQISPDPRELKNQQLSFKAVKPVPDYNVERSNIETSSPAVGRSQIVPQSSTQMFQWRYAMTFQSQHPKLIDNTLPNTMCQQEAPCKQRPSPLPPCNRTRRVGLSRRQRVNHLHSASHPSCQQMQTDSTKKHEE